MNILKTLATDFKEFFFPRSCIGCHRRLYKTEQLFCINCSTQLQYVHPEIVNMEQMFPYKLPIIHVNSLFIYNHGQIIASVLHAMKYGGRPQLCRQMGRLLAHHLQPIHVFEGIDALIPVPLHSHRLRTRGYNQSEEISRGIADVTGIPILSNVLIRLHDNPTQTALHGKDRTDNVSHLFGLTEQAKNLSGKHLLLIDDVLTTGSTLTACSQALSHCPNIRISIVTLAWTKHR